jgi:hypothetical protein
MSTSSFILSAKPELFIFQDSETGEISISCYQQEEEEYEENHILLVELRNGKVNTHESVLNIVRNVLTKKNDIMVFFDN